MSKRMLSLCLAILIISPVSTMAVTLGLGTSSILTLPISGTDCDELFFPPMQEPYPQYLVTIE